MTRITDPQPSPGEQGERDADADQAGCRVRRGDAPSQRDVDSRYSQRGEERQRHHADPQPISRSMDGIKSAGDHVYDAVTHKADSENDHDADGPAPRRPKKSGKPD